MRVLFRVRVGVYGLGFVGIRGSCARHQGHHGDTRLPGSREGQSHSLTGASDIFIKIDWRTVKKRAPAATTAKAAVTQPKTDPGTRNRGSRPSTDKGCSSVCIFSALHLSISLCPSLHASAAGPSRVHTVLSEPHWERTGGDAGRPTGRPKNSTAADKRK